MFFKLHLIDGKPVLINKDTITDIRTKEVNGCIISVIYFSANDIPTEVQESLDEIYGKYLNNRNYNI